jgi:hypothetical protein
LAIPLVDLDVVDSDFLEADDDFVSAWAGVGELLQPQPVGTTDFVNANGFHGARAMKEACAP